MRRAILLLAALAASQTGCFDVNYGDTAFACGDGRTCPDDYECRGDDLCHRIGSSGGNIDSSPQEDGDPETDGAPEPDAISYDAHPPMPNDTCSAPEEIFDGVPEDGSTIDAYDDLEIAGICLATDGPEVVHQFAVPSGGRQAILTVTPETDWPLVVSLRDLAACTTAAPDLSCVASAPGARRINRPTLAEGTYGVVIDGAAGATGDYSIRLDLFPADATFGYRFFKTTGNVYASLSGATGLAPSDETAVPVTIGFDFPYFGATFGTVVVSPNGYLSFDQDALSVPSEGYNNDCLTNTEPNDLIAVFWDDLVPHLTAPVALQYKLEGSAPDRSLSIEWANFDTFEQSPCQGQCERFQLQVTHKVVLHENGDIEMHYGPRSTAIAPQDDGACLGSQRHLGCSATVGLRVNNGSFDADQSSCNTTAIADGDVLYWVAPR